MADLDVRSDSELLSIILAGGIRGSAPLAGEAAALLEEIGGVAGLGLLASTDGAELVACLTRTTRRAARCSAVVAAAIEIGRRASRPAKPPRLASAEDVAAWAQPRLGLLTHEEMWLLALDGRARLRAARCVAKGGLHGLSLRPCDPIRAALRVDASAFVLVHNHPSGDPTPSEEDIRFTAALATAARTVGIPLLDHVVVTSDAFSSVPFFSSDDDEGSAA